MFGRLFRKELLVSLRDLRFAVLLGICVVLSVLSVYIGVRSHLHEMEEYGEAVAARREILQGQLEEGQLLPLEANGLGWDRPPEPLSPLVYGQSGAQGREIRYINVPANLYEAIPKFGTSTFGANPALAWFGILDLSFVVRVVLSLAACFLTYDAVCGEKAAGTLRLNASTPVSRATLVLAKMTASAVSVVSVCLLAMLLAISAMWFHPDIEVGLDDGLRIAGIVGAACLYLVAFVSFGLWMSALSHRPEVAFLGLVGLWTIWLLVIPNAGLYAARWIVPSPSFYRIEEEANRSRWDLGREMRRERQEWLEARGQTRERWSQNYEPGLAEINAKWLGRMHERVAGLQEGRSRRMQQQRSLALWLVSLSPVGPFNAVTTDLARTGFWHHERIMYAFGDYQGYIADYIRRKEFERHGSPEEQATFGLKDFVPFTYDDTDTFGACISRNLIQILILAVYPILGFAGCYVTFLRYDMR